MINVSVSGRSGRRQARKRTGKTSGQIETDSLVLLVEMKKEFRPANEWSKDECCFLSRDLWAGLGWGKEGDNRFVVRRLILGRVCQMKDKKASRFQSSRAEDGP